MALDITRPVTWTHLVQHPMFVSGRFESSWYDGDVVADLDLLKRACLLILGALDTYSVELKVLDDCTFYAAVSKTSEFKCNLYPALTDDGVQCLFFDFPSCDLRVEDVNAALQVMLAYDENQDFTKYGQVE